MHSVIDTNEIQVLVASPCISFFKIRSRRQKEMIERGYHGLEGGFEEGGKGEKEGFGF